MKKIFTFLKFSELNLRFFQEEIFKFFIGVIALVTGIYIALNIDKSEEAIKNREIFNNMKVLVLSEIQENENSLFYYRKHSETKYDIKSTFSYTLINEIVKSDVWMKVASKEQTISLLNYQSLLRKLDVFKEQLNVFKLNKDFSEKDQRYSEVKNAMQKTIADCYDQGQHLKNELK